MRYYRLEISEPSSGQVITPPGFDGLLGGASYTSYVNGQTLPGAWNVELDIPVIGQATPQGFAGAIVWGISRQEISQANNLNGKNISIFGGMQKGLPLANPAQAGLLVQGYIFQAFGNWIGVDQTLDLVIAPGAAPTDDGSSSTGGTGTLAKPKNLTLNWKKNTPLGDALTNTLQTAFPGYTVTVNINSGIVRPNDEVGFFPTLEQLAQYALQTSKNIIKTAGYPGVSLIPGQNAISVFDGSQSSSSNAGSGSASSSSPTQINYQDLIGQPTWLENTIISIKTVMRADLQVGNQIMLPKTQITNTQAAPSSLINLQSAFQGSFTIQSLRHVGNFRQPSADSWVTVITAYPSQPLGAGSLITGAGNGAGQ